MNNKERLIKIIGISLGIILFIGLVSSITFAYYEGKVSSSNVVGGTVGGCFSGTKGNNISNANLLLFDESEIKNNSTITIKEGMAVTSVSATVNCNIDASLTINLTASTLSNAFINGNSVGALKYVITEYSPTTYPTVSASALNNQSFTILQTGTITTKTKHSIYEGSLSGTKNYLVIFYLDGALTMNDAATNNNFGATIEVVATEV